MTDEFTQKIGRMTTALIDRHEAEGLDFGILICSAAAYVLSAWWIAIVSHLHARFTIPPLRT